MQIINLYPKNRRAKKPTLSWCICFFCPPFFKFKKKIITPFFFLWLEKVEIPNYNKCKLLIFIQKIEESRACSKASINKKKGFELMTFTL